MVCSAARMGLPIPAVPFTADLTDPGVLIVATKTRGTAATLATLAQVDLDAAFSIQNGIRKNDVLVDAFGQGRTLGALADLSGELLPTGEVAFTRNVNLMIGEHLNLALTPAG
jgi:2-dehydropantoate 2-reductase